VNATHRLILLLGGLAFVAGCSQADPRPNVILITLDTTRPDFLGAYGAGPEQSPHIDRLAQDGVLFEQAISSSAVTPVSHATILTGLYQYNHGLRVLYAGSGYQLPDSVPTLATAFKSAGYTTATIHSAFPVSRTFGLTRDFGSVQDLDTEFQQKEDKLGWDTDRHQRRSDHTTDLALEFLDQVEQPFFLWLHYWDPHDPRLLPPKEDLPKVAPGATQAEQYRALYASEVRYQDRQLGRLFDGLRERGLYERTAIALTSDHGEGLDDGQADHGWSKHRMVYQEQIWVPLIVRLPGGPQGLRVGATVRTVDVAPTLIEAAGLEPPKRLDGISLSSLFEGSPAAPRIAYADQVNRFDANARMWHDLPQAGLMHSVREGKWKLTYRPDEPDLSELFDIEADPDELVNRWNDEPAVVERLLLDLARRSPWVTAPFANLAAGEMNTEALSALGYGEDGEVEETDFTWTCPSHSSVDEPRKGRHDECGAPLIPIRRTSGN